MAISNTTTLTTAIIYTFYTTWVPSPTTYTIGQSTVTTSGKITFASQGSFTLTETQTLDSSKLARSSSLLSKAHAIASSISAASILGEEKAANASSSAAAAAALSSDKSSSGVYTTGDYSSSSSGSSKSSSSSSAGSDSTTANAAMGNGDSILRGVSLAGALAIGACLL